MGNKLIFRILIMSAEKLCAKLSLLILRNRYYSLKIDIIAQLYKIFLLQQASYGGQPRFPNQQPQSRQIVVRSMPSPGSRNSPYSNPPDSPFHPPSPGVALYQQQSQAMPQQQAQAPQQRLQRAVSIPSKFFLYFKIVQ